jgi:N-acetylglucosaminyl-diphospho-decaprenol L-rhamnosyltransferase
VKLSVVIPVWNKCELMRACLQSLRVSLAAVDGEVEVIVVDDASSDGAQHLVDEEFPECIQLRNECNRGFAVSANRGLKAARGEWLLLLNSDTEITPQALRQMLELFEENSEWDGLAPRLVDATGATQSSCMDWPKLATAFYFGTPMERWQPDSSELRRYFLREFDHESARADVQPPASCWLLRRTAWERVGEFDESLELFFNDVDWALRLRDIGGALHYRPEIKLLHHGGASTAARADFVERWQIDRLRFYRKHHGRLGAFVVKACLSWTFFDWWSRRVLQPATPEGKAETASVRRQFTEFLRCA